MFYSPMSTELIAQLYGVSKNEVISKRNMWNIKFGTLKHYCYNFERENKEIFDYLEANAKNKLFKETSLSDLAKALTYYVFRQGPIEDMHNAGKLSQEDMKKLNKYMVNKFVILLDLLQSEKWLKLSLLISSTSRFVGTWDDAEYDYEDIDSIYSNYIIKSQNDDSYYPF